MYENLDAGYTIILDFYGVSCSSCRNEAPVLDSIWHANQNTVLLWGIESLGYDSTDIEQFKTDLNLSFRMFERNDSVISLYNIISTPTHYVVCPDKSYRNVNLENIPDMIDACKNTYIEKISIKKLNNNIITIKSYEKIKKITIYDNLGREKFSGINSKYFEINLPKKSMYIINILLASGKIINKKIIIN
jgi:hypothetical protein